MTRVKNTGILYSPGNVQKFRTAGQIGRREEREMKKRSNDYYTGYFKDVAENGPNNKKGFGIFGTPDYGSDAYGTERLGALDTAGGYGAPEYDFTKDLTKFDMPEVDTNLAGGLKKAPGSGIGLGTAAKGVEMGARALDNIDDGVDRKYTKKEQFGDASSAVLTGLSTGATTGAALAGGTGAIASALGTMGSFAAAGSTVPVLGTVAGVVIGAVVAGFKISKAKKAAKKAQKTFVKNTKNEAMQKERDVLSQQDQLLAGAPAPTSQLPVTAPTYGYRRYHSGGSFARILLNKASENSPLKK